MRLMKCVIDCRFLQFPHLYWLCSSSSPPPSSSTCFLFVRSGGGVSAKELFSRLVAMFSGGLELCNCMRGRFSIQANYCDSLMVSRWSWIILCESSGGLFIGSETNTGLRRETSVESRPWVEAGCGVWWSWLVEGVCAWVGPARALLGGVWVWGWVV